MIKIGVIGADGRGRIARDVHQPEAGVRLVAGSTLDVERLAWMRETFGPDFFLTSDYRELLRQPLDAVFICTPDYLHEEHALDAIAAGKHVYLEKPLAISVEGCDRVISAAREKGVHLYLGHNMRFFPVMRKMKELIDEGRIGTVQSIWCRHFISYGGDAYFKDWHSEQRYVHSLLLQKGAHDLDVIHWLAGAYTTRVTGMGQLSVYDKLPKRAPGEARPAVKMNRDNWPPKATRGYSETIDVEDSSMLLLQLENGVQACYLQSHYTPDDCRNYTVIGTEGRIENHGHYSTDEYTATVHLWNRRTGFHHEGHEVFSIPELQGGHGGADPQIVREFVDLLRGVPPTGATPWDARMAVAAGYYGAESIRNGGCPFSVPTQR